MRKLYNAKKLLEECNEAYYWAGFILADGYVSNVSVSFTLKSIDLLQLENLVKYLNCNSKIHELTKETNFSNGSAKLVQLSVVDADTFPKFRSKFGLKFTDKTYNPPTLPKMSNEQFLSLLCGYIDGDGCISIQKGGSYTNKKGEFKTYERTDPIMQVKCHSSWESILKEFGERLCNLLDEDVTKSKIRIDKNGYLVWRIYGKQFLGKLKNELEKLNIPKMNRKWDKI